MRSSLLVSLVLAACTNNQPPPSQTSRVDVVKAPKASPAAAGFCDARFDGASAPRLTLPELAPGTNAPSAPRDRWVWLNVWATWCAPCLRELPLIARWQELLGFDLWLLSLDSDAETLAKFTAGRKELAHATSLRAANPDRLGQWFAANGLAADSSIPIHLLAGPGGVVRCVRMGGLEEERLGAVKAVLGAR